ncbi:hypothetical protein PIB30_095347, partial [Stylosanthes scabra]|nr:hypothetical protein [Stylosanthes scabra]
MRPILRWSGMKLNPERPFYGCPNYNTTGKRWCRLFVWADGDEEVDIDSPKTFSFLYKRAIPASGPDQVVSLYEWIS